MGPSESKATRWRRSSGASSAVSPRPRKASAQKTAAEWRATRAADGAQRRAAFPEDVDAVNKYRDRFRGRPAAALMSRADYRFEPTAGFAGVDRISRGSFREADGIHPV